MADPIFLQSRSRLFAYSIAEFMLRSSSVLAPVFENDYEAVILFLTVAMNNTQHLMVNRLHRDAYASYATPVPYELLKPMSRLALARSTGLPRETVRRKVKKMVEKGWLIEDAVGELVAPPALHDHPAYAAVLKPQAAQLRRLFNLVYGPDHLPPDDVEPAAEHA